VIDWNGAQAAIRAGYAAGSAKVTASRLLTNANVKRVLNELKEQIRVACYDEAVNSVQQYRRLLGQDSGHNAVPQNGFTSSQKVEEYPPGAKVKRNESREHETIEICFESRTIAIDHLLKLSE